MKVLIDDGMQLKNGTGIGQHTENLIMALRQNPQVQVELAQHRNYSGKKIVQRIKYLLLINSREYLRQSEDYDIIHFTNYIIPFIRNKKSKYVVTVHDLSVFLHPEALPRINAMYMRWLTAYAIRRADLIVTVSDSVKQEILSCFPKNKTPVMTAYSGINRLGGQPDDTPYTLPCLNTLTYRKFFLFVGTIEKRKNIGFLIKAFAKLKKQGDLARDYKLVLAGRAGNGFEDFLKLAMQTELSEDIIFTGYLPEDDRNRLYARAAAFVFPTVYEGFGTPQLECMRCGLPLILSDIPVNHEVSGEYGIFFSLENEDNLVTCMRQFIESPMDAARQRQIAEEILDRFSWRNIAKLHIDAYGFIQERERI